MVSFSDLISVFGVDDWNQAQLNCPTEDLRWMPPKHVSINKELRCSKLLGTNIIQ